MNQSGHFQDLLQLTQRLGDVLERETAILRARKPAELEAVRRDKAALIQAYEGHVRTLRGDPAMLEAVAPDLRALLKAALGRFQSTLADNERSLRAARESSQRILQAIADEVERQRSDTLAYSSGGGATAQRSTARPPVSVAIDQRF